MIIEINLYPFCDDVIMQGMPPWLLLNTYISNNQSSALRCINLQNSWLWPRNLSKNLPKNCNFQCDKRRQWLTILSIFVSFFNISCCSCPMYFFFVFCLSIFEPLVVQGQVQFGLGKGDLSLHCIKCYNKI